MSYVKHWLALATRIRSLQEAGELYARFQGLQREDNYGAGIYLGEQCGAAVLALREFRNHFGDTLPGEAITSVERFLTSRLAEAATIPGGAQREARGVLVALGAFEAEITFILSGRQEQIRARSERAFLLLNRMLAVDVEVRAKWHRAMSEGEVACERLGSVHLLSQGIYAFKVNAEGARTDLVFPEPPPAEPIERDDRRDAHDGAEHARHQRDGQRLRHGRRRRLATERRNRSRRVAGVPDGYGPPP
jgi:hypothetical protein